MLKNTNHIHADLSQKNKAEIPPFCSVWNTVDGIKTKTEIIIGHQDDLYQSNDYKYLQPYNHILWEEIQIWNILWEWCNGIIMSLPWNQESVIKIKKPWLWLDDIFTEITYHKKALQLLEEYHHLHPHTKHIKIPKIHEYEKWKVKLSHFTMERICGHSIASIGFLKYYPWFKKFSADFLKTLTDREIIAVLIHYFKESPQSLFDLKKQYTKKLISSLRHKYPDVKNILRYLSENGVKHTDLHSWNIMIDREEKLYIIDFWRVNF